MSGRGSKELQQVVPGQAEVMAALKPACDLARAYAEGVPNSAVTQLGIDLSDDLTASLARLHGMEHEQSSAVRYKMRDPVLAIPPLDPQGANMIELKHSTVFGIGDHEVSIVRHFAVHEGTTVEDIYFVVAGNGFDSQDADGSYGANNLGALDIQNPFDKTLSIESQRRALVGLAVTAQAVYEIERLCGIERV